MRTEPTTAKWKWWHTAITILAIVVALVVIFLVSHTAQGFYRIPLQDWDSVEQLTEFLDQDNTDSLIRLVCNANGVASFTGACEVRAFQLRDSAEQSGMRIETEILTAQEYQQFYNQTIAPNRAHMICKAFIGNEVWYIEPSTDRIWQYVYLD